MADGTDHFVPVGKVTAGVVVDLAARRQSLTRSLDVGLKVLSGHKLSQADRDWANRMEVERGKSMITKGIEFIQKNDSPEAAIDYLRSTLQAIDGSNA